MALALPDVLLCTCPHVRAPKTCIVHVNAIHDRALSPPSEAAGARAALWPGTASPQQRPELVCLLERPLIWASPACNKLLPSQSGAPGGNLPLQPSEAGAAACLQEQPT